MSERIITKQGVLFVKVLVTLAFAFSILSPASAAAFSGHGAGTSLNPYRISTCTQLQSINDNLTAYYTLVSNIDCTGVAFVSIAAYPAVFSGTLDGLNHTISNFTATGDSGIFAQTQGATIKNINIASGTASSNGNLGSFVGYSRSTTLDNVHSSITVASGSGSAYVGGLVGGSVEGTTINGSSYSGTISGGSYIGGLVGYQGTLTPAGGSLTNSYFDGTMNVAGTYVGGVMGILYSGNVANVYSSGTINITGATAYLGGIIGITYKGDTSNSFGASLINGTGTQFAGGFSIFYGGASGFSSTRSNIYYDRYRGNGNDVYSIGCTSLDQGTGTCAAVNSANATPLYFKNNQANAPLNDPSWDFTNTWSVTSGYPALRNLQLFNEASSVPNSGDANGDGTQDSYQANVISVQDTNGLWTTVSVPSASGCTLANALSSQVKDVAAVSQSSLTGFTVYCPTSGTTVPVTVIYDRQYDTSKSVIRFYNSTTQVFSTISGTTFSTKVVGGTTKSTATYSLIDGGINDEDGTANGIIKDPVGLAVPISAPKTGSGNGENGTTALVALLVALSLSLFGLSACARKLNSHEKV